MTTTKSLSNSRSTTRPTEENFSRDEACEVVRKKLENLLQLIVDHPAEVKVSTHHGERTTVFTVDCSQRNFSKVLGCKGKMISSLRTITIAMTARYGIRSIVEIPYFSPQSSGEQNSETAAS
ncbi:MAG TPA: KH domain-containing protein [Bdellovibrio sp.]|uniref:KH domain-containing protein n=1 Tax=Bdellovibrio sp. TaxID=28201 RepID=UPI002F09D571